MRVDEFADGLRERLGGLSDLLQRRARRDRARRGLTPTQMKVLSRLLHGGATPSGDLAGALDLAPSTVTRVVDVLVRKRLVRRRSGEQDRRRVHLELTDAGFRTAREMERGDAADVDGIATRIDEARREEVLAALDLLMGALEGSTRPRRRARRRRRS